MSEDPSLDLERFIETRVPELAASRGRLDVLLLSYNRIHKLRDGKVPHDKRDLNIRVKTGELRYTGPSMGRFVAETLDVRTPKPILTKLDGEEAQRRVDEAILRMEIPDDAVAFVYAGLTGFESAIACALRLAERLPNGEVRVVSCECHRAGKVAHLARTEGGDRIAGMLFTDECGARIGMRRIADAFVSAWPR